MSIVGQFTGYSMPMNFFVLQNNVFYVLLGYFLEKAVSTENADSFPDGSYRLVWQGV